PRLTARYSLGCKMSENGNRSAPMCWSSLRWLTMNDSPRIIKESRIWTTFTHVLNTSLGRSALKNWLAGWTTEELLMPGCVTCSNSTNIRNWPIVTVGVMFRFLEEWHTASYHPSCQSAWNPAGELSPLSASIPTRY